jgi:hypothetical protein
MIQRLRMLPAVLLLLLLSAGVAVAETELTLTKSFILKYKNRLTIEADVQPMFFSKIHPRGETGSEDGDIHVAVLPNKEIGLATVVEIQNADSVPAAIARLKEARDDKKRVRVGGVWRFWAEHGGDHRHAQGAPIPDYPHSNPDHIFEIHPVTSVDRGDDKIDLLKTLSPIEDFTAPEERARTAFQTYEELNGKIRAFKKGDVDFVKIKMESAGYNYVKFRMRLREENHGIETAPGQWRQPDDGWFVFAEIFQVKGHSDEPLVRKRRIGFVKDSAPYDKVRTLQPGQCMLVLGMPRLNLELVAWRLGLGVTKPVEPGSTRLERPLRNGRRGSLRRPPGRVWASA